jgi:hypothetical protein
MEHKSYRPESLHEKAQDGHKLSSNIHEVRYWICFLD